MRWALLRGAVAAVATALALVQPIEGPVARSEVPRPNIVFVITDDQRWDTIWAMPEVQSLLVARGTTFENAFATNPECCPSRSSILTGNHSHTTGVYTNTSSPVGGFKAFDDSSTLATWLDGAGYRTALIGKYMNGYSPTTHYVPPGWDRWFVGDGYYDYIVSDQSVVVEYGSDPEDYSTDVFAGQADAFIRGTAPETPLFLYFAPIAPHTPATAPERHADAFADLVVEKRPNYNEEDVSDKPAYIRGLRPVPDGESPFWAQQYRSLLAVDEAVATIVQALEDTGRLANTFIVFTSDNGLAWGEHRLRNTKLTPYEESIRLPLVIRYDALGGTPGSLDDLVVNVDLAPTAADLAGVAASTEGVSLVPLLAGTAATWRAGFLLEHLHKLAPAYCGVRAINYSYVKYETGEEELYDLVSDPFQLENVASRPRYSTVLANLRAANAVLCDPPPPYTDNLP